MVPPLPTTPPTPPHSSTPASQPLLQLPSPLPYPHPSPALLPYQGSTNVWTTEVTPSDITVLWGRVNCIYCYRRITGYSVRYGIHGSGSTETLYVPGVATTEITISGLNSTSTYSIEVATVNDAGIGIYSSPVIATTKGRLFLYIVHSFT